MHQPLIQGGLAGQATEIDIQAREILFKRENLYQLFALHTGQPIERIKRDQERDFFMSPLEALEYGLIDEVMELADKPY
jgi:ATP-dependent Clp protease protease subunit